MIHYTIILEDIVMTATEVVENDERVIYVHVCDNVTGENGRVIWSKEQFKAVMFILANDDDQNPSQYAWYKTAEPALDKLPKNCRMIP